jgi:restriction system protein
VDLTVLSQFEEFVEFRSPSRSAGGPETGVPGIAEATPRETVSAAVEEANAAVAAEVLDRVRGREPAFLEHLVLDVLTAMGYGGVAGAAEHLGRVGDEGLDGVIRQDALGLDRIYVQAKRYRAEQSVGRPEIQAFVGALQGTQADRGIFITTSRFTADAATYAERVPARVVLVDGRMLAELMVKHNIGVQDQETYVIKRIDEDFFEDAG